MHIDDEKLMAFADGELDPTTAAEIAAAVDADPALRTRLRIFSESRDRLRIEAREMTTQATAQDSDLIARIRAETATPTNSGTSSAAEAPANINRRPLATIAAALALAVIGGGLWWQLGDSRIANLEQAHIDALDSLPSGEAQTLDGQTSLTMIASYQTGDGELCREFETHDATDMKIVVACRDQDGWSQRFAADIEAVEGYVPAAGDIGELDAFLADIKAGAPLAPDQEELALTK